MKHNQKYIIPFKGLKDGKHIFTYNLDRGFFDLFEADEINRVDLNAEIQCNKKDNFIELQFSINGFIETICDLCLDYYPQKIKSTGNLYIRFGEESIELSDELIVIPFNQTEFEISQYLFDLSMLGIPFKRQHDPDTNGHGCDPEMIKILRNLETKKELNQSDLRWNILKKIKY